MRRWWLILLCLLPVTLIWAEGYHSTDHVYVISLNGRPVTIDGELGDWADAEFIYISKDMTPLYNSLLEFGADYGDLVESPDDFSAHVAIKMDNENIYFAVHAHDQGGILNHGMLTRDKANLLGSFDAFTPYLGLYDIGVLPHSPHEDLVDIVMPEFPDSVLQSGRTYRIRPGYDRLMEDTTGSETGTLGPDFQFGVHAQEYSNMLPNGAYYASGDDVINYNWGYVDTLIANTEVAILVWPEEDGYTLEWKVPFASMAGNIAKASKPQASIEWPLYTPKDGDVLPFDFDMLDNDRNTDIADWGNNFLRYSSGQDYPGSRGWRACWRDSYRWGGRAVVKELTLEDTTASNYYHTLYSPQGSNIVIDGEIDSSEWSNSQFIGINYRSPNHIAGWYEFNPLASASDWSGHVAIQMDDENLYFAANMHDEGGVLNHEPRNPLDPESCKRMWFQDCFQAYLGLFDMGDLPGSPHKNVVAILNQETGDTIIQIANDEWADRTYRVVRDYDGIPSDTDPDQATLGPDYQIGVALHEYPVILANGAYYGADSQVVTYNWGWVDTMMMNTEVGIRVWDNEDGYTMEWKVPFASLAGYIASDAWGTGKNALLWPLYEPKHGDVIPFDIALTDEDRIDGNNAEGPSYQFGMLTDGWRWSYRFGMRMKVVDTLGMIPPVVAIDESDAQHSAPKQQALLDNYPNPFNPQTTIRFQVQQPGKVTLKVYDILGKEVATVVNQEMNSGTYLVNWDASAQPSGMYFYRLQLQNQVISKKMMLLK